MTSSEPGDARQVRAAQNQALFRSINDRMSELASTFASGTPTTSWVCECADTACAEQVELTSEEYEGVREEGARFVVSPSDAHVASDVEAVVRREERYWVVEKLGLAGIVAEKLDDEPAA